MLIDVDFNTAPPTLADISEEREQAVSERAEYKKKNKIFAVVFFIIIAAWATFLITVVIPMIAQAKPDWGMLVYFFPYLTFFIFIIANEIHTKKIEKPSKLLDKRIDELTEGTTDEINAIISNTKQSDEIVSYLEQVTAQGRLLVRTEIDAIQQWFNTKS